MFCSVPQLCCTHCLFFCCIDFPNGKKEVQWIFMISLWISLIHVILDHWLWFADIWVRVRGPREEPPRTADRFLQRPDETCPPSQQGGLVSMAEVNFIFYNIIYNICLMDITLSWKITFGSILLFKKSSVSRLYLNHWHYNYQLKVNFIDI